MVFMLSAFEFNGRKENLKYNLISVIIYLFIQIQPINRYVPQKVAVTFSSSLGAFKKLHCPL